MRPTIGEQLDGVARILREVVAPHVTDDNAREQLAHSVNVLLGVATGWTTYARRVEEDGLDLAAVLRAAGVAPEDAPDDPGSREVTALDEWHESLRSRLEVVLRERAEQGLTSPDLRAYLLRHTTRFG